MHGRCVVCGVDTVRGVVRPGRRVGGAKEGRSLSDEARIKRSRCSASARMGWAADGLWDLSRGGWFGCGAREVDEGLLVLDI